MTRREFLKLVGMGGLGMLAAPGVLATMATTTSRAHVAPKLLYDGRYANATAYANRLRDKGIPAIDTQGDLVGLWHRNFDAFRLQSAQAMLGYTTWSDYQALRILLNDARRGRVNRLESPADPGRLVLLPQHSSRDWPEGLANCFSSTLNAEKRVHLVAWSLTGD